MRHEFVESVVRVGGDAGQDVAEVGERFDVVSAAGGQEGEEDRGGSASVVGAAEQPVFRLIPRGGGRSRRRCCRC